MHMLNVVVAQSSGDAAAGAALGLILLLFFVIMIAAIVIAIAGMWKTFTKAGEDGWKAIIPFYNMWVLAEISGRDGWVGLLVYVGYFIPFIGFLIPIGIYWYIGVGLTAKFHKESWFPFLTAILPMIALLITGFGSAEYDKDAIVQ